MPHNFTMPTRKWVRLLLYLFEIQAIGLPHVSEPSSGVASGKSAQSSQSKPVKGSVCFVLVIVIPCSTPGLSRILRNAASTQDSGSETEPDLTDDEEAAVRPGTPPHPARAEEVRFALFLLI